MCSDGLIKPNEGHSLSSFSLAALGAQLYIYNVWEGKMRKGSMNRACVRFSGRGAALNWARY